MTFMKKHHFLLVDLNLSVHLKTSEEKKIKQWLGLASAVLETMARSGLLDRKVKKIRVSLLVCGNQKIKKLNRDFRNKDKITDVLSFPAHESIRGGVDGSQLFDGELFLGDMAICLPRARKQAKAFDISLWDEFIHLFFHGMLHLIGYDHEISPAEERLMQALEDKSLSLFSKKKGTKRSPK
jgi:probable rRNA maturation factor